MQSAEEIYRRLILNAARVWGYTPEEMEEEGFDPLVGLMLGGVSKELEKAYQELEDSKSRIVTDLATHLTPDVLTNVLPAHGIMHSLPIEVNEIATKDAQFISDKKSEDRNEQIIFAPADNYSLVKASVKYLVYKNTIYDQKLHKKEPVLKAVGGKRIPATEVWLGIDVDKRIRNFDGFRFFLDWSFDPDKLEYLKYLQMTKWSFADMDLKMNVGLKEFDSTKTSKDTKETYLDQVRRNVVSTYSSHFLSVEMDDVNLFGKTEVFKAPEMLTSTFGEGEVTGLKGHLAWVRVIFPQLLSHKSLEYVNCNLNCYPAINTKYHIRNISLKERKTFFPVQCDGSFLSIISLNDKYDKEVVDERTIADDEKDNVTYIFKEKGIQRFDNREAKELLDYLFDVLRDESFAFHKYNVNIQSSTLKNLRQQVNALVDETKKDKKRKFSDNPFLIFSSKEFPQIVKIEYCATLGEVANKIPAGTKLKVLKGILVDGTSLAFMSSTWGGRSYMDDEDKIRLFKHALMSRNALVTKMDVISFCHSKLGSGLEEVKIEHGSEISLKDNEGIIRTMNIYLTLKQDREWDENELTYLKSNLKNEIERKSCFIYPIRIITD